MGPNRAQRLGNTLIEYGFIGAILVVAGLSAAIIFGTRLDQYLMGFKDGVNSHINASETARAQRLNNGGPPGNPGSSPAAPSVTITLSNGQTIELTSVAGNLPDRVATAGANGTTDEIADALAMLAQQLLDAGEITPEQAGMLRNLANQGHRIARIEELITTAALSADESDAVFYGQFHSMTVNAGHLDSSLSNARVGQLANLIRNTTGMETEQGAETRYLCSLLQEAQNSGALNNPQVASVVETLVNDIVNVADQVHHHVTETERGVVAPSQINTAVASALTDIYSSEICTTGGDSDTGTLCN